MPHCLRAALPSIPTRRAGPLGLLIPAVAALFGAGPALAEVTLSPYIDSTTTYDSNLFRVSDNAAVPITNARSKSDVIFNNSAGLDSSYSWSNQRLHATVEGSRFQYLNNTQLNQNAFQLNGGLDWSLLSRVTGTLTASNTQTRSSFANGDITVLNRQRQRNLGATVNFKPANDLDFNAGFVNQVLKTPAVDAPNFEVEQNTWNSSLDYIGINRFRIGVLGNYSRGNFSGTATNSSFNALSAAGSLAYDASDISKLALTLGYTTREEQASQTKTRGLTGGLVYSRELTGKTSTNLGVTRSVDASQFGDNTVINTSVFLNVNYSATARINASLQYNYLNSKFKTTGNVVSVFTGRTDDLHTVTLGASYEAFDWLAIAPSVAYETRTANLPGFNYESYIASMQFTARLKR